MATPDRELRILHPTGAQLQTLAHPLRSRLLGALRFHGPATVHRAGGPARHQQRRHQLPPAAAGGGGAGGGRSRALQRSRPLVARRPRRHLLAVDRLRRRSRRACGRRLAGAPPGPRRGRLAQRLAGGPQRVVGRVARRRRPVRLPPRPDGRGAVARSWTSSARSRSATATPPTGTRRRARRRSCCRRSRARSAWCERRRPPVDPPPLLPAAVPAVRARRGSS